MNFKLPRKIEEPVLRLIREGTIRQLEIAQLNVQLGVIFDDVFIEIYKKHNFLIEGINLIGSHF